jgi:hypothetical protein
MIEMLAKKCRSGDLWIHAARRHLEKQEWGMARIALEHGLEKGELSDIDHAIALMVDIRERLGLPAVDTKTRHTV